MEEKMKVALDYLCDAINMTMVLSDSLKLSFQENNTNDYQYTVAKNILIELENLLNELNIIDCELCALKKG